MRSIRYYEGQRYFNVKSFLKEKGYKIQTEYHLFNDHIQIKERWCEIWSLHLDLGAENYLIVRQKQPPYAVYIIDVAGTMITSQAVKKYIESGIVPEGRDYLEGIPPEVYNGDNH